MKPKAQGIAVEERARTCKPRIYRIDTDMKKMADCQDKDPQLIPKVSIDAHAEGLDGLVGPTISKKVKLYPRDTRAGQAFSTLTGSPTFSSLLLTPQTAVPV